MPGLVALLTVVALGIRARARGVPWSIAMLAGVRRLLFTVLPPDPQGLDHDQDGIGCEPIA